MLLRTFITLLFLTASASAYASQVPYELTPYASTLGRAQTNKDGETSFSGSIEITGKLHVIRSDDGTCKTACAFFAPDRASQARLPHRKLNSESIVYAADSIDLGEAGPILARAIGKKPADRILRSNLPVYVVPATITLSKLLVYVACDAAHYSAHVASVRINQRLATYSRKAEAGGC